MKKIVCVLLLILLVFSLAACFPFGMFQNLAQNRAASSGAQSLTEKVRDTVLDEIYGNDGASAFDTEELIPYHVIDPYDALSLKEDLDYSKDTLLDIGLDFDSYESGNASAYEGDVNVYSGYLDSVFPGMDDAKCYVYYDSLTNVYLIDYRHYTYGGLDAYELVEAYELAVASIVDIYGEADYNTSYLSSLSFDSQAMVESVESGDDFYHYYEWYLDDGYENSLTAFLVREDDELRIDFTFRFPYAEDLAEPIATPSPQATGKPDAATTGNEVIISDYLYFMASGDPYEEDCLTVENTTAEPDGNGGYDCTVTFQNHTTAVSVRIYYVMYALGSDYMEEDVLTEDVFARAGSNTYEFHVPSYMLEDGDCEVFFDYEFDY